MYVKIGNKTVYAPDHVPPSVRPVLGPLARLNARKVNNRIRSTHPDSPMVGEGRHFVEWGRYFSIDYRLPVAIAGQETEFDTTGRSPEVGLFNPFGYGPFWAFLSYDHSIYRISRALRIWYIDEGYNSITKIASKWAPIEAANDPKGLNREWINGVTSIYIELGGLRYL